MNIDLIISLLCLFLFIVSYLILSKADKQDKIMKDKQISNYLRGYNK
jgi:hypothetical protein